MVLGHRYKIGLGSDNGTPGTQVPFSTREQSEDLVPGHGHYTRILVNALGKMRCVHIRASENRIRAPCSGNKCEHSQHSTMESNLAI